MSVSVGASVAFSVLLVSVAFGVHQEISQSLSNPLLHRSGLVDVPHINTILVLLTLVVTLGMMAQTAASTFVLGVRRSPSDGRAVFCARRFSSNL
jgi:hypothetical protein